MSIFETALNEWETLTPFIRYGITAILAYFLLRKIGIIGFDLFDMNDDEPIDEDEEVVNSVGMLKEYRAKKEVKRHSKNKARGLLSYIWGR